MGDTWPDGPPDEAYSRVTRDLASVTAGFAAYLDDLPDRLTTRYRCRVRPLTRHERVRVVRDLSDAAEGYAVEPDDPDCATLLVARAQDPQGGTYAVLAFGIAAGALIPDCLCDACDSDSAELIEQTEGFLEAALTGCREHRGPHRSTMPERYADDLWLEEGVRFTRGIWGRANASIRGEPFTRDWKPWPERPRA